MVKISGVEKNSFAERAGIAAGDILVSVNGNGIADVLDYRFYLFEPRLELKLLRDGAEYTAVIKKPRYDDIGLEFLTSLMDE